MGRRKQSAAEDLMDLVALLPWWMGVGLAAVSYVVLHRMAIAPTSKGGVPGPDFLANVVIAGLATAGQYVVPVVCCLGALVSILRRKKRAALLQRAGSREALAGMSWREFELLVGEAYRQQGFSVGEIGGGGADGGVDLVLKRGNEKIFVQCKHWKSVSVGVSVVRELYGVMALRGATGGIVVTAGTFTAEARSFASESNVQLVDGEKLASLLERARSAGGRRSPAPVPPARPTPEVPPARQAPTTQADAAPTCPVCQSAMVRRTARKGSNAGSQFWGCARYPQCKGTR